MSRTVVGKVGKTFGQGGDVTVGLREAFDDAVESVCAVNEDNQEPLHVVFDGLEVPLFVDSFERRGRTGALVRFADVDTPQRAEMLVGKELLWGGSPADDGEDFADVVGWQAEIWVDDANVDADAGGAAADAKSPIRGIVTAFWDGTMNPLLQVEIKTENGAASARESAASHAHEVLLPVAFVDEIDEKARKITLTLPEGLLELNT